MKKLIKCNLCGNVCEFLYIGSRNVNKSGEVANIVGSEELWISYYKCPECGNVEVELHPLGEKPDNLIEVEGEE